MSKKNLTIAEKLLSGKSHKDLHVISRDNRQFLVSRRAGLRDEVGLCLPRSRNQALRSISSVLSNMK